MKEAVLKMLKQGSPEFVSGEEICRSLNVTRTAVWKNIKALKEDGYKIEARSRAGYLFKSAPDIPYPGEIREGLVTRVFGRKVYYYDSAPSTNVLARELAQKGAPEGALVITEEQTGGKGRLGRGWHSPRGMGLWFSLIFRPPAAPAQAVQLTILAAVALTEAIRKETGIPVGIKWPNDLLFDGKKICGILTEMSAEMERVNYLVIGAGINVSQSARDFAEEVRDTATSLFLALNRPVSRVKLLQSILESTEKWYDRWLAEGFTPVLGRWKELSVTLRRPVRIHSFNETWDGWAEDLDEEGALIVQMPDRSRRKVVSGEVSLRLDLT